MNLSLNRARAAAIERGCKPKKKSPIEVQHHRLATAGGRAQTVAAFSK
jgi:hypothetical protein